jgi:parvulin-like peptidyl-prolyl isomerase
MPPTTPTEITPLAQTPSTAQAVANAKSSSARLSNRLRLLLLGAALFLLGGIAGSLITHLRDPSHAVVASVNGTPITQEQFFHRLQIAAGTPVLRQMTTEELLLAFARQMGVLPTEAEVQAKYDQAQKQPGFTDTLAKSHQTPEDLKHSLLVNLARAAVFDKGVSVTDADIRAFYTLNADKRNPNARYYRPQAVQLAVIITDKTADIDKALHALASGTPFATAARALSKDRSSANGGLLAPLLRGRMDAKKFPGLEARLFAMQSGQQIDRVKVAGAWWIIRCVGKQAEATIPFDQVKEECREGALLSKGLAANGKSMQEEYAAFQKEAQIKALWPDYAEAVNVK